MKSFKSYLIMVITLLCSAVSAEDTREWVKIPEMMQQHMLSGMRDHLSAITEIQQALANSEFETAAKIAEKRIGMSSLSTHGAAHLSKYLPKPMQEMGMAMHHAASQFALIAQESAIENDVKPALAALSKVTQQCVACHAAYRVH